MKTHKTQVLIIGGGATGTGIARDLALRGIQSILVEKGDLNAGASGANHGLLHSGARYVAKDPVAARECHEESRILKKTAPQCIENTGGIFVSVKGDDENYAADFPGHCQKCGIPVQSIDPGDAREIEPILSPDTFAAYLVEDAAIDPFRLSLENITQSIDRGGRLMLHTQVTGFTMRGRRIQSATVLNSRSGDTMVIEADQIINAGGAWAGEIAAMAGVSIDILYSKGSLLITDNRLATRVINRLRPSSDADILVPGGTVSILGTTSIRIDSLDVVRPRVDEMDYIIDTASGMVPELKSTRYIRAYAGVRPLVGSRSMDDDRAVSRGWALIDHDPDGVTNLTTITGGKLTTYRQMAEKTSDLVCQKLGITAPCVTRTQPLPSSGSTRWTEAGLAPKLWFKHHSPEDMLLCECEMVPKSAIDAVIASMHKQDAPISLRGIGLRSRIGKGTCQGAFCGIRITAYLYACGQLHQRAGVQDLQSFLDSRWKGIRPILWDKAQVQEELQEAVHCGLFGMEL